MKYKRDLQATVASVLAHASLIGGFSAMQFTPAPPPTIQPKEVEVEYFNETLAKGVPDGLQATATDPNAVDNVPENEPMNAELTEKPKPTPAPPPRVNEKPVKTVAPAKPVQAPVQRWKPPTADRVTTPRTPANQATSTWNKPQPAPSQSQNNANNTGQPSRPSAAPISAAPKPNTTPSPVRTSETSSKPPTTTSGGVAGTTNRPGGAVAGSGTTNAPAGSPTGRGSGHSVAEVFGLDRRAIRRTVPRHTELVNSTIDVCVTVSPDGSVVGKSICKKGNAALEASSLAAVSGWRFNALSPDAPQENQRGKIRFRFVVD